MKSTPPSGRMSMRDKVKDVLHSFSSSKGKTERRRRPFLTSSQLSDLFTRLDKNGDGELDLEEFTGIARLLKLDVTEDTVARIFRRVDTAASGTLDLQEFVCAYQKLYNTQESVLSSGGSGGNAVQTESFVRATRYGVDGDGQAVFELYTVSIGEQSHKDKDSHKEKEKERENESENKIGEGENNERFPASKFVFAIDRPELKDIADADTESVSDRLRSAREEKISLSLEDLNGMIYADSLRNEQEEKTRILWWVDVALKEVQPSTVNHFVSTFGLPNSSKFRANFGYFGSLLPKDAKSRVFVGEGVTDKSKNVQSLSMFVQTTTLKDRPLLHLVPVWVENKFFASSANENSLIGQLKKYYRRHVAFCFNLADHSDTNKLEFKSQYVTAASIAGRLNDHSVFFQNVDEDNEGQKEKPAADGSIIGSGGLLLPLTRQRGYHSPPHWLASSAHINKRPPSLRIDTLSLHVIDQGVGVRNSNALLTIRAIDDESAKNKPSLEEKSRRGVVGRILDGLWFRLLENVAIDGLTDIAAELDDRPSTLASIIVSLLHSYSMNTLGALDYWVNAVEEDVKDMVVSKHTTHVKQIRRIVQELSLYVEPIHETLTNFVAELEKEETEKMIMQDVECTERDGAPVDPVKIEPVISNSRPNNHRQMSTKVMVTLEKLPLSHDLMERFFGNTLYRELRRLLDGFEVLELKGLVFWKERLEKYEARLQDVEGLIASQLDEKRNFMSFSLTIVTTLLAPVAILTGYFGMNFDNMHELNSSTYKYAPGVELMWILCGVIYGAMLLLAIHFRIIYSAT